MLGVTEKGTVTAMKKEGSGSLDVSSVEDMLEVGTPQICITITRLCNILRISLSIFRGFAHFCSKHRLWVPTKNIDCGYPQSMFKTKNKNLCLRPKIRKKRLPL